MGLILPKGPDWGYLAHNYPATYESSALGTSVTAGASNTDGAAVTLLSALSRDVEYLKLYVHGSGLDATQAIQANISATILIDPAGGTSWQTLIPNLLAGRVHQASSASRAPQAGYDFPLWIPAGASVGAMARTAHSADLTVKVLALGYGGNANPASWWCGQRVSDIGTNPAASSGTTIAAGAGSAAFGSWTNLGSALGADCGAIQMGTCGDDDTSWSTNEFFIELGRGSAAIPGLGPLFRSQSSSEIAVWTQAGLNFRRLAAGTQLQARAASSLGGSSTFNLAAYAVH